MLTLRIAFAPSLDFVQPFSFFEPSSDSTISVSSARCSRQSLPISAGAITVFTLATACETPLPEYGAPPSRSSSASNMPVDAPLGATPRKTAPVLSVSSHSTVGFPRESKI